AIAAALHPGRVRCLALLEAPLRFGDDAGDLARAAKLAPPAQILRAPWGGDLVPGSLLTAAAVTASPTSFVGSVALDGLMALSDPVALRTHLAVRRWALDEFPMPARLFDEAVEQLFREDRFARGILRIGDRQLGPRDLGGRVLAVVDPASAVVPPQA